MTATTKHRTSGHAHRARNGHAPASRLAESVPPLERHVSHGDTAEAKPAAKNKAKPREGRTAKGTFAAGNKCARGNPTARKMAALRSALLADLDEERMRKLGKRLYDAAMAGNWLAMKLLLQYAIGKAPEAVDADRLDLEEWRILDAAPTIPQVMRALLDNCDPVKAADILQVTLTQSEEKFHARLFEKTTDDDDDGDGDPRYTRSREIFAEQEARVGKQVR